MKNYIIIFIISILIIFFSSNNAKSQNLKYKDVHDVILTGDKELSYTLLLAYQKQDPDFAVTYLQLGVIAHEWAKTYNPFTDYFFTKLFIYNSKLFYNLARHNFKNESKSNYKYYENIGIPIDKKKLSEDDIIKYIDKQTADIAFYELNINKIIKFYNKTVESYNICVETFKQINTRFSIIKNIYLSEDTDFMQDLVNLENYYDSTLIYFDKYKAAITEYPIKNYNQTYKLKKIVTYRLDGLTNSNFLENNITLWDYKTWADDVRAISNKTVSSNKSEVETLSGLIDKKIEELANENYSDETDDYKIDEKFIYKIGKFDHNSLLVKLFLFRESKVNYLIQYRKTINNPKDTSSYTDKKLAAYYKNLTDIKIQSDSLNRQFAKEIKPEQVRKYQNYYMKKFGGFKGLQAYTFQQELYLNMILKNAFLTYKNKLEKNEETINYETNILSNKEKEIKFSVQKNDFDNATTETYYVVNMYTNQEEESFLTGFTKTQDNKIVSFAGKTDNKGKILFIKPIAQNDSTKNCGIQILASGNLIFIITVSEKNNEIQNIITKIDKKGNILSENKIPIDAYPRYLNFDDINNTLTISFKGKNIEENTNIYEKQITVNYETEKKEIIFKTEIELKGMLAEIVRMDSNIFIFNNYKAYKTLENTEQTTVAPVNIFLTITDNSGNIIKQINYQSTNKSYANKAIKINSNTINLIGYKNKKTTQLQTSEKADFFYFIINSKGKATFSNIEK